MNIIKNLSSIADKYPYYIIDLWGVLHDGITAYPGAIDALKNLKAARKKIVLLSNAPRRAAIAREVLDKLGFSESMYDMLITSGEVTYDYVLHQRSAAGSLGRKYYYIGPEKDRDLLKGLDCVEVEKADADFALATGFDDFTSTFEEKQHQLDECLAAKLHLLVANPDKIVVRQTGEIQLCAGLMGIYYLEHGGELTYFGKPHHNAYIKCLEFFGTDKTDEILCIGDSLHTDIAGGNMLGADTLLVTAGIHKKDFYTNGRLDNEKMQEHFEKDKGKPTYLIERFIW